MPTVPESELNAHARQAERDRMVETTIIARGIKNPHVLAAMRRVPRHLFVAEQHAGLAYADRALPLAEAQTVSQPYIVAAMTDALVTSPGDNCLEIGTGSGYQTAVLSELCDATYSVEYLPAVAELGKKNLERAGYLDGSRNIHLRIGDGYLGWPEAAPFDAILVTAAPRSVPAPLLEQLALGGSMIVPVGPEHESQCLWRYTRVAEGNHADAFAVKQLLDVRFVPFLGGQA